MKNNSFSYCKGVIIIIMVIFIAGLNGLAQPIPKVLKISLERNSGQPSSIRVQFNQPMNAARPDTFSVHGSMSGKMNGIFVSGASNELVFETNDSIHAGDEIEVTITKENKSESDIYLDKPFVYKMRVPAGAGPAEFKSTRSSQLSRLAKTIVLGDINGDGNLDMVIGNSYGDQKNRILLNDGSGNFVDGEEFSNGDNTWALAIGDVDGDHDLDLISGNGRQQNHIYLNNGNGTFKETSSFGTGDDNTQSIALGDLDGDGDLDMAVGNGNGSGNGHRNYVYLNDGKGNFGEGIPYGYPDDTRCVKLGDLDNDGDLDIAIANWTGFSNAVYLNDGSGHFTEARYFGGDNDWSMALDLGDVNGDGYLDIAVGRHGTQQNYIYINDGSAHFNSTISIGKELEATHSIIFGDIDGDNDLDLILNNSGHNTSGRKVYLNDGYGNFLTAKPIGQPVKAGYGLAAGDIDGDGDLDLAVAQENLTWLLNTESSDLSTTPTPIPGKPSIEDPTQSVRNNAIQVVTTKVLTPTPTPTKAPFAMTGNITIQPEELDFGQVQIGQSLELEAKLTNVSNLIQIGTATIQAPFSLTSGEKFAIPVNGEHIIKVKYSPTTPGPTQTLLHITNHTEHLIHVVGEGVE